MAKKTTKRKPASAKKTSSGPTDLVGVLLIGDPHVDAKQPGFRTDNFAETILKKIEWSLEYAAKEKLQPVLLGDLFDKPRGNPNWLIHRLIEVLSPHNVIGIYGNHDCADTSLNENDSLSLLIAAGCLRLVSYKAPFHAMMNDRDVFIGGSSYREPIPQTFQLPPRKSQGLFDNDPFAMWITHHDIGFPGYDNARLDPHQITNVELLVNGHIHRRLESVQAGRTLWMTPGNIARRSRSEAALQHAPAVTRIDVLPEDYKISFVEIPHRPAGEVFIELVAGAVDDAELESSFVSGLAELTAQKTAGGFGLRRFLSENIDQFELPVANVILQLADEAIDGPEDTDA
jgi:DNA repair exonuclease SbcCD nuclease subunit